MKILLIGPCISRVCRNGRPRTIFFVARVATELFLRARVLPEAPVQLPEFLLGTYSEVKPRVRRFVKAVVSGEAPDLPLIDTKDVPGLLVLDDPWHSLSGARHFQLYAVLKVPTDKEEYRVLSGLADRLLSMPWGPLSLMGQDAGLLRLHKRLTDRQWAAFLVAVAAHWATYAAEGARYTTGAYVQSLWGIPTRLLVELGARGVTVEEFRAPLPSGSLKELLLRHPDKFGDVLAELTASPGGE